MESKYADFINQIPDKIKQDDERYLGNDLALFRPKNYVVGKKIEVVDYHIFLLSSPPPDIYIDGKQIEAEPGKIFTINPGESLLCKNAPPTKPFLSILIKPEFIKGIAIKLGLLGEIKFLQPLNQFSSELIQAINCLEKETRRPDQLALMLDSIAIQIVILLLRELDPNSGKTIVKLPDNDAYINLAIEYMQEFYSSNLAIEDICKEIHISPFHFIRTFKQKTGISPYQYLMNVRICKAEELLRAGHHSVAEVASQCGFINSSHFSSTFKSITGYSPTDYKKLSL